MVLILPGEIRKARIALAGLTVAASGQVRDDDIVAAHFVTSTDLVAGSNNVSHRSSAVISCPNRIARVFSLAKGLR